MCLQSPSYDLLPLQSRNHSLKGTAARTSSKARKGEEQEAQLRMRLGSMETS